MGLWQAVTRNFRGEHNLSDYLPWLLLHKNEEYVLTATGGVLRVARLDLPDFESASAEALVTHHDRLALVLVDDLDQIWLLIDIGNTEAVRLEIVARQSGNRRQAAASLPDLDDAARLEHLGVAELKEQLDDIGVRVAFVATHLLADDMARLSAAIR